MEKDITAFTDDELKIEIKRREAAARQAELDRRFQYSRWIADSLTPYVIDTIAPEHGRTSCTDEDLANGWGSGPRCVRCALLETVRDTYWPKDYKLRVSLEYLGES